MSDVAGELNGLDLFTGIGGITLALRGIVRPVAYCENDRHAQHVLLSRMATGDLPQAPIWDDVRTLSGSMLSSVDIVYGGFPCQDISAAGRGAGLGGERSGLYWELHRLVKETSPAFVFLENVPAIRTRGLRDVVRSFTDLGYDCRWTCVSAEEVGAPHLRKRWFLLAHSDSHSLRVWTERESGRRKNSVRAEREGIARHDGETESLAEATDGQTMLGTEIFRSESNGDHGGPKEMADASSIGYPRRGSWSGVTKDGIWCGIDFGGSSKAVAYADGERFELSSESDERSERESWRDSTSSSSWWDIEPDVGRVADGVPFRVDRLRGLGNSVVPLQARTAFERLLGYE